MQSIPTYFTALSLIVFDKLSTIRTMAEAEWSSSEEYAEPIYIYMRELERQQVMTYKGRSPQLRYRAAFVDLINTVCTRMGFCDVARHLSVNLLDFYMDDHDVAPKQLELIALGCLVIAG
ncbi:hypothetical protein HPB50_007483 [Hyalomma asiaticum]|uniref:Uncharacterized protein n=1 Tax=Hyalomma asiaticum TaxID=266040 RepID=A0ACB7TE19_HYAAI|nr:hypothetical protein HPB50_007483 [Hyalomma asiaticum]